MKTVLRILIACYFIVGLIVAAVIYYRIQILNDNYPTGDFGWGMIVFLPGIAFAMIVEFLIFWLLVLAIWASIWFYGLGSLFAGIYYMFTGKFEISDTFDIWGIQKHE